MKKNAKSNVKRSKSKLLVSAVTHLTSHDCDALVEDEILVQAVGHFDHHSLLEYFFDEGVAILKKNNWKSVPFRSLEMIAQIWQKIEIDLPLDLSTELSLEDLEQIHSQVADILSAKIDDNFLPSISQVEVWMTDASGKPTECLTASMARLEGEMTERQIRKATEEARLSIPSKLISA